MGEEHQQPVSKKNWLRRKKKNKWQRNAYVLAFLVLVVAIALYYPRMPASNSSSLLDKNEHYESYESQCAHRKKVVLADGTEVTLNSTSRLYVPESFSKSRQVILNGEAYFNVVEENERPFVVKTDKLTATTLGTSFKIRSMESQPGATLYVRSGKLRVVKSYHSSTDNEPATLGPGDMILANKQIDLMETEHYEVKEMDDWLTQNLELQDVSLPVALRKLEDWYGIQIEVRGNYDPGTKVNAQFKNAGLQEVMTALGDKLDFDFKIKGNKVVLKF
ncbi:hypothetical protein COR50_12650 [Chitinophaga caeni]|uniref:FecR protein domain-containing protein n=1 Tax=Chitinophaga caeni TaxID=2029983 RepID=A0A291QV85_9BACT|nr:FecR family protein [Chitinophaga caeni]ATL47949.1 hypothetical protein COR50_12650 [Chitinophaga caeni]